MVVRAEGDVVKGHNGIFRSVFIEFLRDFLIAQDLYVAYRKSTSPDDPVKSLEVE
jgi:hypothetical protein